MKKIILESPYAGNVAKNIEYARKCVKNSLIHGEAPIASHLLYTQNNVLNDENPDERMVGINAGLAWKSVTDLQVFYVDYGISKGMQYGMDYAKENNIPYELRRVL